MRLTSPHVVLGAAIALTTFSSFSQQVTLFPINQNGQLGKPVLVGNSSGYNNQPAFTDDSSKLLFSSNNNGSQMDIFAYDIATESLTNLTQTTDENEFSPQPGDSDNEIFYVVEQGTPDQSVWRKSGSEPRKRGINSFIDSGYYARIRGLGTLLWARYGHHLYFEPIGEQADERHFVAAGVGRSIHAIPTTQQFSFVDKQINGAWVIKRFEPASGAITPIVPIDQTSEDYSWKNSETIWKGNGSALMQWQNGQQSWQQLADLSQFGVGKIGRLDISPDEKWLAVIDLNPNR